MKKLFRDITVVRSVHYTGIQLHKLALIRMTCPYGRVMYFITRLYNETHDEHSVMKRRSFFSFFDRERSHQTDRCAQESVYDNPTDEYWIDRVGTCGLERGDYRPCSA